jgi:hypothetical protein
VRRYPFAPDDAPLYQVPTALGGGVFPAIREEGGPLHVVVELDVPGVGPVRLAADNLQYLANPLASHADRAWVLGLVARALEAEDECAHMHDSAECLGRALSRVPTEVLDYAKAWHRAGVLAHSHSWTFPHTSPRFTEVNGTEG